MADDPWFLKLDGIEGESTGERHKDQIDVSSWSWGATSSGPAAGGGGGGGAGKASFQDLHVVTRISKASPALMLACASGKIPQSPTGKAQPAVTAGWDLKANKQI